MQQLPRAEEQNFVFLKIYSLAVLRLDPLFCKSMTTEIRRKTLVSYLIVNTYLRPAEKKLKTARSGTVFKVKL